MKEKLSEVIQTWAITISAITLNSFLKQAEGILSLLQSSLNVVLVSITIVWTYYKVKNERNNNKKTP